jgi:hypothetical protein
MMGSDYKRMGAGARKSKKTYMSACRLSAACTLGTVLFDPVAPAWEGKTKGLE